MTACELVVRYRAAATGIQRMQSMGRIRKAGGTFLTIVLLSQHGSQTQEGKQHENSILGQRNMMEYLDRNNT
jgi:ERCC4-related helicase